jgi:hypothetical protein
MLIFYSLILGLQLTTQCGIVSGVYQQGQLVAFESPETFIGLIPEYELLAEGDQTGKITLEKAVFSQNGRRTIASLQNAGRKSGKAKKAGELKRKAAEALSLADCDGDRNHECWRLYCS